MKQVKAIALVIGLALSLVSTNAKADCVISVQACKAAGITKLTYFVDSDAGANKFPHRCLERAREYFNWCGNPLQTASSMVRENGVVTVGNAVNRGGSGLFSNGMGHWIALRSAY